MVPAAAHALTHHTAPRHGSFSVQRASSSRRSRSAGELMMTVQGSRRLTPDSETPRRLRARVGSRTRPHSIVQRHRDHARRWDRALVSCPSRLGADDDLATVWLGALVLLTLGAFAGARRRPGSSTRTDRRPRRQAAPRRGHARPRDAHPHRRHAAPAPRHPHGHQPRPPPRRPGPPDRARRHRPHRRAGRARRDRRPVRRGQVHARRPARAPRPTPTRGPSPSAASTSSRRDDVRDRIRLAGQDAHLLAGTIAANVRIGRADATDHEIERRPARRPASTSLAPGPPRRHPHRRRRGRRRRLGRSAPAHRARPRARQPRRDPHPRRADGDARPDPGTRAASTTCWPPTAR